MYETVLAVHNVLRWVALLVGVVAAGQALMGWLGHRKWTRSHRQAGSLFAMTMDIQLLLGLILYLFLSPITRPALRDFGGALRQPDQLFFAVEHVFIMVLAVVFAHLGSSARKLSKDEAKFKRAAIWFTLAVILILVGMPWARPLFPGL